jgi:hypothetical protein
MARVFTGSTNTTRLDRTVTAPASVYSIGCWAKFASYVTNRVLLGTGTTVALWSGLKTGNATAQRIALVTNCATTDMQVEVAAPATGGWYCAVGVHAGLTATANPVYLGDIATPMAAAAHVADANGAGAVAVQTAGSIGKNAAVSTAIDGTLAFPFMVPWVMTADEVERYREGDWSVLFRGGTPTFFVPMEGGGAAAYDLAVPGNWTVTSAPAIVEDPPISFGFDPVVSKVIRKRVAVTTNSSPGGGMTPSGAAPKLIGKPLSGAFT